MPDNIEKIENIDESKFYGKHNFLAEGLLEPLANHTNGSRGQMFSSHIVQAIQINGSEPPLIGTGFENQVGKYSSLGYKKLDGNWNVLKRINKNAYNYILIIQNKDTREYGMIYRHEAINLTESFGVEYDNKVIDAKKEGDPVGNEVLFHDHNYDDMGNLQMGTNLNVAYVSWKGFTNEDAIVISESAAKRLSSYFVRKIRVNFNTNDIALNLFGDENTYKCYPKIGEPIDESRPMLVTRRIDYQKFIYEMKNNSLSKILDSDTAYYGQGKIIDIDIYNNEDIEKFANEPFNEQFYDDYCKQKAFQKEFVDFVYPIISNKNNKVSNELRSYYDRYSHFLDEDVRLISNVKEFDNRVVEFTILYHDKIIPGMKISNRYGAKGVISKIVPDDQMPTIKEIDGKPIRKDTHIPTRADICVNPLGVINRLNISQLLEQETNFIGQRVRYRMEEETDLNKRYEMAYDFVNSADKKSGKALSKVWNSLKDDSEKAELLQEFIDDGFYIQQQPYWDNINIFDLGNLYEKFNASTEYQTQVKTPLILGEIYYIRLHHNPNDKLSARSVSHYSYLNLPAKTADIKTSTGRINKTPIRLGEMETINTGIIGSLDPIIDLMDKYANNSDARMELIKRLLTGDPFNPDISYDPKGKGNNNIVLDANMLAIGLQIVPNKTRPKDRYDFINDLPLSHLEDFLTRVIQDGQENNITPKEYLDRMNDEQFKEYMKDFI